MKYSIIISTIEGREKALDNLIKSIDETTKDYEVIVYHDKKDKSIPVAEAWNKGAERATGDYLVFLNDDMQTTIGWLDEQEKFYKSHLLVGSLAFKVYDDQGNIQSRGHSFNKLTPYLPPEDVIEVDYSDHPFVTKKLWKRVGGFTAHGHMYYEDADFGLKLQSAGFKNYYNPNAVLYHTTIGLRTGTDEDKKRRYYNENVIQQQSKVSFFKTWSDYLLHR